MVNCMAHLMNEYRRQPPLSTNLFDFIATASAVDDGLWQAVMILMIKTARNNVAVISGHNTCAFKLIT